MSARRNAALSLVVAFPLILRFFGALALLALGGGWATFLWFGGGVAVSLYVVAFSVVTGCYLLDRRDAQARKRSLSSISSTQ